MKEFPMGPTHRTELKDRHDRELAFIAGPAHLHVRPARPSDLPLLEAMVGRSSSDTVYRRFHGALGNAARAELRRISRPSPEHRSWVAVGRGGVRGTVTLAFAADGQAEIALFVEDDWFRHGVGRALAHAAIAEANRLGVREVVAYIQPENFRAREFFRSVAPGASSKFEHREVVVRIPVAEAGATGEPADVRHDATRLVG
jgi:N-acetylglutamate synthase-like GNAT family acetyltransferase